MKNKSLAILFLIPFLSSCVQIPDFDGLKVKINASNNGGIHIKTPNEIYEYFITNNNSGLLLFSSSSCEACLNASQQLDLYGKSEKLEIYKVEMDNISLENYNILKSTTSYVDEIYALPDFGEELYLPNLYLFMSLEDGAGVANTTNANFVDFVRMYVEVI